MPTNGVRFTGERSTEKEIYLRETLLLRVSPLSKEIFAELFPEEFEYPELRDYEGTGDPVSHVKHFRKCMRLRNATDAMMCKFFLATLYGLATTNWYEGLSPGCITNFSMMAKDFCSFFSYYIPPYWRNRNPR